MLIESSHTSNKITKIHESPSKEELWDSLVFALTELNRGSCDTFKKVSIEEDLDERLVVIVVKY